MKSSKPARQPSRSSPVSTGPDERAFAEVGVEIDWKGSGVAERGHDRKTGKILVEVDKNYFRPTEVDILVGDATKAREKLGWTHTTTFAELITEMVANDLVVMKQRGHI